MPDEKDKAKKLVGSAEPPQPDGTAPPPVIPEEIPEEDDRNTFEKVRDTGIRGVVKGIITEPLDMVGDLGDFALDKIGLDDAGDRFNEMLDTPDELVDKYIPKVEGTGYAIAEGVVQFTVPFLATGGASAAVKGTKAVQAVAKVGTKVAATGKAGKVAAGFGKFALEGGVRGAVVDFSSFDPMEIGLADLAANSNVPGLKQLGNALSVHDTDDRLTGRLKKTAEGAVLGTVADATLYAVRGAYRARIAGRLVKGAEEGHKLPSELVKRDQQLAEAGLVTDPAPAQVIGLKNDIGEIVGRIEPSPEGGFEFAGRSFEDIDEALGAAKKEGLSEETIDEAAARYREAAEEDIKPILERVGFTPEEAPLVKNTDPADIRPSAKDISDFERNLDKTVENIQKSLDDPASTPAGLRKLIEEFPMNWKHYLGNDPEASGPVLLVSRLFKKNKLSDDQLSKLVSATLEEGGVSKNAALQARYLATLNQHEPALNVLLGQAVSSAQGKRLADLTGKIRHAASVGAEETVHSLRKIQRLEFKNLVQLQKEYADYVGGIGRGLRANKFRSAVDNAVLRGQEAGSVFADAAEKNLEDIGEQFSTVPFKEAEDWINAMSDDEILQLGELIELAGGKAPDFADLIKRARVLSGNEEGLSGASYVWQSAMEWQTAGLLSGGRTMMKILASNELLKAYEMVWTPIAGSAVPAKGLSKAQRRAMREEGFDNMYGLMRFAKDGLKAAGSAWKHNLPVADPYVVRELAQIGHKGRVSKVMRTPFRVINTLDTYAKVTITRTRARTDALKKARAAGMSAAERADYAERMADAAIDSRTGIVLYEPGREVGAKLTMMSPMNEGESAKAIMDAVHKVPILQPFVKFLRPAAALLTYTGEHVPGFEKMPGLGKRLARELEEGGPEAVAKLRAKRFTAFTGLTVMTGGYAAGQVTAGGPREPALRKEWLRTHKPYSVKVGDKWVNYLWTPGAGPLIGMWMSMLEAGEYALDDASQAFSNVRGPEVFSRITGALLSSVMEQSYLTGIVNFAEFMTADDPHEQRRAWTQLGRGFAFAPFTQMLTHDPNIRDAQSMLEDFQASIPGLSQKLPPKYDAFGQPIAGNYGNLMKAVDPFKTTETPEDVVSDALAELDVGLEAAPRYYKGKMELDLHSDRFGKWNGQTPWETYQQVMRGEWKNEKGERFMGLHERVEKLVTQERFKAVVDEDYRKEQMALGKLSEAEYATLKKKLYAGILELKSGVNAKALDVLISRTGGRPEARYPELRSQIKEYVDAEKRGETRFLE